MRSSDDDGGGGGRGGGGGSCGGAGDGWRWCFYLTAFTAVGF